ncbi:MAG: ABC transporter permease [Proteobacteria bacterium]|nr:ABC transporter permease [Pseudomonadota bacterium]
MKTILFIATKDFLYTLKDKSVLIWMFVMPLVFFGFIGSTTQSFGGSSDKPVTLAIWSAGEDDKISKQIFYRLEQENFSLRLFNKNQLLYKEKHKFEDYKRRVWLPASMQQNIKQANKIQIEYQLKSDGLGGDYDSFKLQKAIYQILGDLLIMAKLKPADDPVIDFNEVNQLEKLIKLDVQKAGIQQEIPSGFNQAVPGVLVMFIMMLALTSGGLVLFLERKTGVVKRLAAAPISRRQLVFGKWLGKWFLTTCQLIYGMIMGALLFNIHWGDHWLMVFVLLLAWSAACAGFGVYMGSVARNEGQINGIPVMLTLILAALGGCWWPIEVTPEWMQTLALFLPTGWVMDALHKLMYFGASIGDVLNHQLALYTLALISIYFAFRNFNYEVK